MYENGHGVNQDQQQALMWYRKAAHLGLGDAEDALKRLGESFK
jgi:TPR repeat protein